MFTARTRAGDTSKPAGRVLQNSTCSKSAGASTADIQSSTRRGTVEAWGVRSRARTSVKYSQTPASKPKRPIWSETATSAFSGSAMRLDSPLTNTTRSE